jgi:hypothetical protein
LGAERCWKYSAQTGTIVGLSSRSSNIVRVQLDGTKRIRSLHRTYIQIIENEVQSEGLRSEGFLSGNLVGLPVRGSNRANGILFDTKG